MTIHQSIHLTNNVLCDIFAETSTKPYLPIPISNFVQILPRDTYFNFLPNFYEILTLLPDSNILALTKVKAFADDTFNFGYLTISVKDR